MPDKTTRECRWCGQPFMASTTAAYCGDDHRRMGRRKAERERARRYSANNREAIRKKQRRWRANNREAYREKMRVWRAANPEKSRELTRKSNIKRAALIAAVRELGLI